VRVDRTTPMGFRRKGDGLMAAKAETRDLRTGRMTQIGDRSPRRGPRASAGLSSQPS
jgi:hypothetical protein